MLEVCLQILKALGPPIFVVEFADNASPRAIDPVAVWYDHTKNALTFKISLNCD
jgi:hypothetical protein